MVPFHPMENPVPSPSAPARTLRVLAWSAVALLGAVSVAVLAWSRGEHVNALWMVVASLCVFAISYRFHSAWLMAKVLTLDDLRATPAEVRNDGRDFVKTNKWVVFGHHFAGITGAGPLLGPVLAMQFGYAPGIIWLLAGVCLAGAVHDMLILWASTRRGGRSLADIARSEIGPVDRSMGFVFGMARGLVIIGLAYIAFAALVPQPDRPAALTQARLFPMIQNTSKVLLDILPETPREFAALRSENQASSGDGNEAETQAPESSGAREPGALERFFGATGGSQDSSR